MIETHEIPDGIMLVLEPFNSPNRNSACKVIAEIRSTRPERRDVRFRVEHRAGHQRDGSAA